MGIIQKVGKFLGVDKFAKGLATTGRILTGEFQQDLDVQNQNSLMIQKLAYAIRNEKNPEQKTKLMNLSQQFRDKPLPTPGQIDPGIDLTTKEVIGSAANVALNVAMPGAFKGGKVVKVAKNVALGAGFGAASGLEKDRDISGIIGSTTGGALVGAGIGTFGLAAKAAKDFIGATVPEWLMNNAIKPALQDLKKNVRYGGETLGKQLLDEGVKGGPKRLLEIANTKTIELENQLQSVLTQPGLEEATIVRDKIIPYIKDLVEQKSGTPGMGGDVQRIKNIVDSIPKSMTIPEANIMKRRIYTELRDVAYKLDAKLGTKAAVLKQIARGLKTEIENATGGTLVKDINQKLSIYGRLENSMVDQLARSMRNNGLGLTDAILLAGGDTTSILALLRHLGQRTETYVAQGLSNVKGVGTGAVGKTIKEVGRRGIFNLP